MAWHEPWWTEIWSSVTAMSWAGFSGFMPTDLAGREPYRVITRIADDSTWIALAAVLGMLQFLVATTNCRAGRWAAASAMACFWLCLAVGIFLGNTSSPGVVVYLGWGCANMCTMLLLFRQPRND